MGGAPASVESPIPKEALGPILQAPFKALALKTGFQPFELSQPEVDALVPMTDQVLKQYLSVTSMGPHAALITLATTLTVLSGVRYMSYLQWRRDSIEKWNASQNLGSDISKPAPIPNEARSH